MRNSFTIFILFFVSSFLYSQNCVIDNLFAEIASDCYDDGTFDIDLEFDIENGNNSGFDVFVNNEFFQYVPSYPNPFVRLQNVFRGNGSELLIRVQDNDNPICNDTYFLTMPDCPGSCSLDSLSVEFIECNLITGNYTAYVDWTEDYEVFTQFQIYLNDEFYGAWNSGFEMPQIFNFEGASTPNQVDVLRVCANDSEFCCVEFEFEVPDCSTSECVIDQLFLQERTSCDAAGQYYIFPGFTSVNLSDSVNIFINGENQGRFSSEQFNYQIGPFDGNGAFYQITVCDSVDPDCCKTDTIQSEFCQPLDECFIDNLNVEKECLGDGTFNLYATFDHAFTSETVRISGNSNDFGEYSVFEQPIVLGPIEEGTVLEFMSVVDAADVECRAFEMVKFQPCPSDTCNIQIASATKACDGANNFITLEYIHQTSNMNSSTSFYVDGVLVQSNTELNNPVTIFLTGLPNSTDNTYTVLVVDENDESCSDEITLCGVFGCEFQCEIYELSVEEECLPDGTYLLNVSATSPFGIEEVNISGNGENYGNFDFREQPFVLGPFESGTLINELTLTNVDNEFCQACIQFEPVMCESTICSIGEPTLSALRCDSLGLTYSMNLDFEFMNAGPTFSVAINGQDFGSYSFGVSRPLSLSGITPRPNSDYDIIQICANNVDDCCVEYEYIPPSCEDGDCLIDILDAEVICEGPVVFIEMAYNYLNPFSEAHFYVNGELFEQSSQTGQNLGIQLGPIPAVPNGVFEILVWDAELESCQVTFLLDNPCSSDCFIGDVVAIQECLNADGLYNIILNFEFGASTELVQIVGNGNDYGIFSAFDQPIVLGPFTENDLINEFVVIDIQNPDCRNDAILVIEDCEGEGCNLSGLELFDFNCNFSTGTYNLTGSFQFDNPTNDSYDIWVNGEFFNTYPLQVGAVFSVKNITPRQNSEYDIITICVNDNPDCCIVYEYMPPECGNDGDCVIDIWDYFVICDGPVNYLRIDYSYINPLSEAHFFVNGDFADSSGESGEILQIILGPFPSMPGDAYIIAAFDAENEECFDMVELTDDCNTECFIGEIIIEQECLIDGSFLVQLFFDYMNTSGEVLIRGNGQNYGQFDANENIVLGPFSQQDVINEFVVIDSQNEECSNFVEFDPIDCENINPCTLSDLIVDVVSCDETTGVYNMVVNFNHPNVATGTFDVWVNNEFYDQLSFEENPPFVVENVTPRSNSDFDIIRICVTDSIDCCVVLEYVQPDCIGTDECDISNIEVVHECLPDGGYFLYVSFDHFNTSEVVNIRGNGNDYGVFNVFEQPIELGPFQPGQTINELVIFDPELDCGEDIEFDNDCDTDCFIGPIIVEQECLLDGTYLVHFFFEHMNTSGEVIIRGNGQIYGQFGVNEDIILGPFSEQDVVNEFIIIDSQIEDCRSVVEFEAFDCEEDDECDISNIEVDHECLPNGEYFLYVVFDHINTSELVNIRGNGNNYGLFNVFEQPIQLGPFEPGQTINELVIFDINLTCVEDVGFEMVNCDSDPEPCDIRDIVIETFDCDPNTGMYQMDVTFNYENPGNDFFEVWINDEYQGFYLFSDFPPIGFTDIAPRENSDFDIIRICVNDVPDCCMEHEYMPPLCEDAGPCEIGEPSVQIECNPDGTFFAYLSFSYANISSFVNIRGNGENYGDFNVDDQPFKIGPLPGDGTTMYEFVILDVENEACRNFVEIGAVECEEAEGCQIFDIGIFEVICDEANETYDAVINFSIVNPTNGMFDVWVNNEFYDSFSFDDNPPFAITDISPRENSDFDIIRICVNDDEECCQEFEFLQPSCIDGPNSENDARITNIDVEPLDCNDETDTYSIRVDFDTENYNGTSFNIYINDVLMPSVSLNDLPVIYTGVGPRENSDSDIVRICIGEDDEICEEMEYDQPDCLSTSAAEVEIFEQIRLYPNPTNSDINFNNLPSSVNTIVIIDNLGRQRLVLSQNMNRINVSNLENGIYFIKLITVDNYSHTVKFIKIE